MSSIVLINKYGIITNKKVNNLNESNIYKKAGFRKPDDFDLLYSWNVSKQYIHMYGKKNGKANNENKFELPPPVDKTIYYGTLTFIKSTSNDEIIENIIDFNKEEFTKFIDNQFGGFESIGSNSDDDYETDELEEVPTKYKTKEGYLKDDFVVSNSTSSKDSSSDEDFAYDSELQYESYSDESDYNTGD